MKKLGIYIHIPFCAGKCLYCDFCSRTDCLPDMMLQYAGEAAGQMRVFSGACAGRYTVDSVYFGGGTPTLMPLHGYEILLGSLYSSFSIADDAEITAECNPATADERYLGALRTLGVNRLSIGAQSMDDGELRSLGRLHTREGFLGTFAAARRAGFSDISVDLMFGIPGQSRQSWFNSLGEVCVLDPDHVSAYGLKLEEGTPLARMAAAGRVVLPNEDETADMYESSVAIMEAAGLRQYEISNFAKPGHKCRHNMKYWMCEEYLGIGIAAHSYFAGERFACHRSLERYLAGEYTDPASRVKITPRELETEFVMLTMRTAAGLPADEYRTRFGTDPHEKYGGRFSGFVKAGYVITDGGGFRFTVRGMLVSSHILAEVLDL